MNAVSSRRKPAMGAVFVYALLIAAAVLLFCSKSSPAYPINEWSDANIYLTLGRGMAKGQVIYRDLYDHKGPLIYALHMLCAFLSPTGFWGVYVLETLCMAAFLTIVYRLLTLCEINWASLIALPLIALLLCSSNSFSTGDSAEELCLPLMMFSFYDLLRHFKTEYPRRMETRRLILSGALFGCVFWLKFTLVGVYAAFLLLLFVSQAVKGHWKAAFACVGWFAAGFLLSTLPWLLYFGLNNAIRPWLQTYLYDNLFLYSENPDHALGWIPLSLQAAGRWFVANPGYAPLVGLGLVWGLASRNRTGWERTCVAASILLCSQMAFNGFRYIFYYGLAMGFFAPLGMIWPCRLLEKALLRLAEHPAPRRGVTALCCAASIALCPLCSPNVAQSFGQPREETVQYQFAKIINAYEEPTLMYYWTMDFGFYLATDTLPTVRYFALCHVPSEELHAEPDRYIENLECDFVITRGSTSPTLKENYTLVATFDAPEYYGENNRHFYLWRSFLLEDAEADTEDESLDVEEVEAL